MEILKLKQENAKALVIVGGGIVLVILVVVVVNKVFGGFGALFTSIFGSPAEKAAAQKALDDAKAASNNTASPWNAQFYDSSPNGASIDDDEAKGISDDIWDAYGWFMGGNSSELMSAIKKIAYQVDLSLVSKWFASDHGNDLYQWLNAKFGNNMLGNIVGHADTMTSVNQYVNSLPKYY